MSVTSLLPWHHALWQRLQSGQARQAHAWLLRGRSGIGKVDFALHWSRAWLCETPTADAMACGQCSSCNWFEQGNHPDFRLLTLAQEDEAEGSTARKKATQISIAQVRALGSFFELSSHRAQRNRLVVIHPAEALNNSAANALLKMLEEPPADMRFILVSHQSHLLLPTVISRCRIVDMPMPTREQATYWLQSRGMQDAEQLLDLAGGAPLQLTAGQMPEAKQTAQITQMLAQGERLNPYTLATSCVALGMETAIDMLQKWVHDLLSARLAGEVRYYRHEQLAALAARADLAALLGLEQRLRQARRLASHPLNATLQFEALLLQYMQLFTLKTA
ncbi:DNA polymerase III subunit delta' [Methylobacillus flagellatus]|uniref:DNA polymerase III subunit delta' n=1 Tax=Methylobacillus flagellatus TaxID=405 RepID=UPI0010F95E61|nr:DNA polymerase III subunit delta' [Methylobacillus flagellatus]